jgi:outer membrane protein assembly factor BamB
VSDEVGVPTGVLIELGEDRSVTEARAGRPRVRRAVAVCATVSALTLLGGAQVPPPPALAMVATVPAHDATAMLLTPRELYLAQDTGADSRISVYAMPGGVTRWRTAVTGPVRAVHWVADAGALLATDADGLGSGRVTALDSRTGRLLWTLPDAAVLDVAPGGRALLQLQTGAGPATLDWLDVGTGRPIWSRPVPADADVAASHDPDRPGTGGLLITDLDGAAQLLAEDTGAVLASGQLGSLVGNVVLTPGPAGGTPAPAPQRAATQVLGGQILVQHRRTAGPGSLTAFDTDTLTEQWSITGDLLSSPFLCRALLCLGATEGVRAVDPTTGAVRWSAAGWQYASPLSDDRLLGYPVSDTAQGMGVLDAATGYTLGVLDPGWTQVLLDGVRPAVLARRDSADPDRYWFAVLTVDPIAVRSLGYLDGLDNASCQVASDLLACRTLAGELRVWRMPD